MLMIQKRRLEENRKIKLVVAEDNATVIH